MDLYQIIGVSKTARSDAIKKAYRKLAQKFHPDKNPGDEGAAEKFRQIDMAWKILGDEKRREKYDATGDMSDVPQQTPLERAVTATLSNMLASAINQLKQFGQKAGDSDMLGLMRELVQNDKRTFKDNRNGIEKAIKDLEDVVGRFTVDDGQNVLNDAVVFHMQSLRRNLEDLDFKEKIADASLEALKTYRFRRNSSGINSTVLMVGGQTVKTITFGGWNAQ